MGEFVKKHGRWVYEVSSGIDANRSSIRRPSIKSPVSRNHAERLAEHRERINKLREQLGKQRENARREGQQDPWDRFHNQPWRRRLVNNVTDLVTGRTGEPNRTAPMTGETQNPFIDHDIRPPDREAEDYQQQMDELQELQDAVRRLDQMREEALQRDRATQDIPHYHFHRPLEISIYTVRRGENLWDIAEEYYGDGHRWRDIYRENRDVIGDNPNLIHPNTKLNLPHPPDGGMDGDPNTPW